MKTLRPSNAERWANCPGSVSIELGDTGDKYAKIGNAKHSLIQDVLAGNQVDMKLITENMAVYINYLMQYKDSLETVVHIERKLYQDETKEEDFMINGTPDCVIQFHDHLEIVDYKNGFIWVDAVFNFQILLYAYLAAKTYKLPVTKLVIVQSGTVKSTDIDLLDPNSIESITLATLLNIQEEIKSGQSTQFKYGSWCRFCPLRFDCPSYAETLNPIVTHLPNPFKADNETLAKLHKLVTYFRKYLVTVEEEMDRRVIERKEVVPGYTIGTKNGIRTYSASDEDIAKEFIDAGFSEDQLYERKLKSYTKLEKMGDLAKQIVDRNTVNKVKYVVIEDLYDSEMMLT